MDSQPPASVEAYTETSQYVCALTHDALDVQRIINSVQDNAAGAISARRETHFKVEYTSLSGLMQHLNADRAGKVVTRLVYQAYSKLAIKTLSGIAARVITSSARSEHQPEVPAIVRCAIHHRLGEVPVGEASIVIAVSAPHRKEAFDACEEVLEEVKKRAQIWKKEYYNSENDEAEWKANT